MFEKFTHTARAAVMDAQEQALRCDAKMIDTSHLLLAVIEAADDSAALLREYLPDDEALNALYSAATSELDPAALTSLGIDLTAVSKKADTVFGPGALSASHKKRRHMPFAHEAKRCLELALREAVKRSDREISTRHILLGILREECAGRTALSHQGVDTTALQTRLRRSDAA
ncbi:Clp protease N-terminal domain-containing protein [Paramicrobacterium sp. CJ85]|uniref:Clp protease N-terminal domain-containing protein n=1 Tax=Paramicrobacterium sp. CJ85 TaxID=3445355 RepID=UPI003F638F01